MSDIEVNRQLANFGKGMIQVNLRLTRILELLEGGGGARPSLEVVEPLLDLLRLLTARRAGESANKSAELRELEGQRQMLYAVNFLLSTRSEKNYLWSVDRFSPRAA